MDHPAKCGTNGSVVMPHAKYRSPKFINENRKRRYENQET
jgi:hypothetical protein